MQCAQVLPARIVLLRLILPGRLLIPKPSRDLFLQKFNTLPQADQLEEIVAQKIDRRANEIKAYHRQKNRQKHSPCGERAEIVVSVEHKGRPDQGVRVNQEDTERARGKESDHVAKRAQTKLGKTLNSFSNNLSTTYV